MDWLHHPCRLGGPPQRGKIKKRPTRGRIGYITLTVRELPVKETKSEMAYMCVDWLHHPCLLESQPQGGETGSGRHVGGYITPAIWGVPIKGTKSDGTTRGRIGYITPAVWGVTNKWAKIIKGPHVGGLATSPLPSGGVPNKGIKSQRDHM